MKAPAQVHKNYCYTNVAEQAAEAVSAGAEGPVHPTEQNTAAESCWQN